MARGTRLAFVLAGALALTPAAAHAQFRYTFAGIQEHTAAKAARAKIEAAGYSFVREDEDGDLWFEGSTLGQDTEVLVLLTPDKQVAKVLVNVMTPDEDARSTFKEIVSTLKKKYGKPAQEGEFFKDPYKKGDGKELEAIRQGKALIVALWDYPGSDSAGLVVEVSKKLTVQIEYQYPNWSAESDRREKAKVTSVF